MFEAVVTTSLPGEERIFWVCKDAQFYIREGEEKVRSTGNFDIITQIIGEENVIISLREVGLYY